MKINHAKVNEMNTQEKSAAKTEKSRQEEKPQLKEHCSSEASNAVRNNVAALLNNSPEPTMRKIKEGFFSDFDKEYNPNGTLKSKTTPFSHKEYDEFGRIKSKETLSGKIINYNKNGYITSKIYPDGTTNQYDRFGSLKYQTKEYPDGSKQEYRYDSRGLKLLVKETFSDGTYKEYDRFGNLAYETFADGTYRNYIAESYERCMGKVKKPKNDNAMQEE